jgi:hypothetical protein
VRSGGQASSSIVSIRLSFDKDYGTRISYWNKGGNNIGHIEATGLRVGHGKRVL